MLLILFIANHIEIYCMAIDCDRVFPRLVLTFEKLSGKERLNGGRENLYVLSVLINGENDMK